MSANDAYRILEIFEGASPDEIKNAYRIMALKWHPDRHHNCHNQELAVRHFGEATDAYRTLVRYGRVKTCNPPIISSKPEPSPARRPPPMAHKTSSESSISLDSFVHMVASGSETHTTPASSQRESLGTTWRQGVRQPSETIASQYRNNFDPGQPRVFNYEAPSRGGIGPAMYRAPTPFAPIAPQETKPTKAKSPKPPKEKPPSPSPRSRKDGVNSQRPSIPQISSPFKATPAAKYNHAQPSPAQPPPAQPPPAQPSPLKPNPRTQVPPYAIPLYSIGLGQSGEWVYSLSLTLEELFVGKHLRFGITRSYQSNKSKNVIIELDIPAGCRPGTRILCRNIGHEWTPVRLPWVDSLRKQGGKVPFIGIDGRGLMIQIDYPRDKNMKGRSVVQGAGMPIRERGQVVGRGNLIVQWVVAFHLPLTIPSNEL
ncbi:hypothetical protein M413DRAFT_14139 [Hebeloma cylindrosporum]|uniref:J domain-containing protein n=1 Tax=Hebeloma cylindrosporum TaxID=76867 RepID=A0A0C2XE54_HEBCY|nr:hypothetical protein M413DRAFT_14139 [Hebeloma cylindrosporum h7]